MKEEVLFDQIKEVSLDAEVQPSDMVWNRLETRLDSNPMEVISPPKTFKLFSWRSLSIAASIVILIGSYTLLNNLNSGRMDSTAIQLEDLHTLEVNPKYNVPAAGDAATIPSIRTSNVIIKSYNHIDEGTSGKKLVRKAQGQQEYGLG